jgi:fluoride exporter
MADLIIVALGGGIGAGARHLVNLAALRGFGPNFPWHTALINVVGSFGIGLVVALLARRAGAAPEWRLFLVTGVLGGFTTFSAFSLDFAVLWGRQQGALAMLYVLFSVAASLAAVFAGLWVARALP